MDFLVPQKYFVVPDTGWSDWDLKICARPVEPRLVLVCTENHGGDKRLLRVRCAMRLSRFWRSALLRRLCAALAACALILGCAGDGGGDRRCSALVGIGGDRLAAVDVWPADAPHHRGGGAARPS